MLWALNREVLWRKSWKWKLCNVKITLILVTWHREFRYRCDITTVFSFEVWSLKFNYAFWQRSDCASTAFLNDFFFICERFFTCELFLIRKFFFIWEFFLICEFFLIYEFSSSTNHLRSSNVISSFIRFWNEFQL